MAGLQYNFFPTDFFYPRPQSAALDAAGKPVLLRLQQDPAKDAINIHNKLVKAHPLMHKKTQVLPKDHDEAEAQN